VVSVFVDVSCSNHVCIHDHAPLQCHNKTDDISSNIVLYPHLASSVPSVVSHSRHVLISEINHLVMGLLSRITTGFAIC
jgi:hypothetical protein